MELDVAPLTEWQLRVVQKTCQTSEKKVNICLLNKSKSLESYINATTLLLLLYYYYYYIILCLLRGTRVNPMLLPKSEFTFLLLLSLSGSALHGHTWLNFYQSKLD